MKKIMVMVGAFCLFMSGLAMSQEGKPTGGAKDEQKQEAPAKSELSIEKAVVAKGVENREPVEPGETFSKDVGTVYCFAKIVGAKGPTDIKFTWYNGDKDMGTVSFPVSTSPWRTWASKTIEPSMTGAWKVEIKDSSGNLLATASFKIE
jgi:hypothetical protein